MSDPATAGRGDVVAQAGDLVAGLAAQPWGQVSPSIYETGRLVTLAPWLTGHTERLEYLVGAQRADGGWGSHDHYSLVPTLSATEALLGELRRGVPHGGRERIAAAADRGLDALFGWSRRGFDTPLPDMPAIELIVPYLTGGINRHLHHLTRSPLRLLSAWEGTAPLPVPRHMDDQKPAVIAARLRSGAALPEKLHHALEVAGEAAAGARGVPLTPAGTIGASPAATAAWLGTAGKTRPHHPARRHLEAVAGLHGGPVPCGVPITAFERGWVLSWLVRAGVPLRVPDALVAGLGDGLGPEGTPAGPGLPPDADTTSVALYALALLGAPREPGSLWRYRADPHFQTWHGEQGFSTTVNAHVLDCFGQYVTCRPGVRPRYATAMGEVESWLLAQQRADGSWSDRWHVSPYYATMCCVLALDAWGGRESEHAVRRAVRWILAGRRAGGGWGLWRATAEETAYAMQTLLLSRAAREEPARDEAAAGGHAFLLQTAAAGDDPPMWVDKELYIPLAIVRAAILGALNLAQRDPGVTLRIRQSAKRT
ncbi:hypothetical protein GCM10022226_47840 [Sphaerisporangium flaviroseum]|uniref:Squalene cyclase C-terminal domain-containing protein n=1 Tax=Sphaerisporangium flaviroseum TaxID=509199 RepID=A0ABP7IMI8_9ACTN